MSYIRHILVLALKPDTDTAEIHQKFLQLKADIPEAWGFMSHIVRGQKFFLLGVAALIYRALARSFPYISAKGDPREGGLSCASDIVRLAVLQK